MHSCWATGAPNIVMAAKTRPSFIVLQFRRYPRQCATESSCHGPEEVQRMNSLKYLYRLLVGNNFQENNNIINEYNILSQVYL